MPSKAPRTGRPSCKNCRKPLRPQYTVNPPAPLSLVGAGGEYQKWVRDHKEFTGHYGGYSDDFFCGLNCGYRWAVRVLREKEAQRANR